MPGRILELEIGPRAAEVIGQKKESSNETLADYQTIPAVSAAAAVGHRVIGQMGFLSSIEVLNVSALLIECTNWTLVLMCCRDCVESEMHLR